MDYVRAFPTTALITCRNDVQQASIILEVVNAAQRFDRSNRWIGTTTVKLNAVSAETVKKMAQECSKNASSGFLAAVTENINDQNLLQGSTFR